MCQCLAGRTELQAAVALNASCISSYKQLIYAEVQMCANASMWPRLLLWPQTMLCSSSADYSVFRKLQRADT